MYVAVILRKWLNNLLILAKRICKFCFLFSGKDAKHMVADEFSRDCRNLEK